LPSLLDPTLAGTELKITDWWGLDEDDAPAAPPEATQEVLTCSYLHRLP
jgi:hypothetical protein